MLGRAVAVGGLFTSPANFKVTAPLGACSPICRMV